MPILLLLLLLLLLPARSAAQTLIGRVLDQSNDRPVAGATVALVSPEGAERGRVLTDVGGRFTLTPPEGGEYQLLASGLGYYETQSPLLALVADGRASIDLALVPEPIGLEGLEVSVEESASEMLWELGLTPAALGGRWIDRPAIDAIPAKRDVGTIIEMSSVPGTRVVRMENVTETDGDIGLCIGLARGRTQDGRNMCAVIMLDGVPVTRQHALQIDPDAIESIAVLVPREAATFFGTVGGGGVVLMWTRRGR
jgi:hypothetical protein